MVEKTTLIDHIQKINRSARTEWLSLFDPESLRLYLEHLQHTLGPRGEGRGWVRRGDTAAAVTRRAEN